jgi:hypothetical protein
MMRVGGLGHGRACQRLQHHHAIVVSDSWMADGRELAYAAFSNARRASGLYGLACSCEPADVLRAARTLLLSAWLREAPYGFDERFSVLS